MTDNTQELRVSLINIATMVCHGDDFERATGTFDFKKLEALITAHTNKQIEAVLDRIHQRTVRGDIILGEPAYLAITRAIEAERKRLGGQK